MDRLTIKSVFVILISYVDYEPLLESTRMSRPPSTVDLSREVETMTLHDTADDAAGLTIEVYTTPGRPIVSSTAPVSPDDLPTWSPCSSTLIYGDHEAILVDAFATFDQADALADWIDTSRRWPRLSLEIWPTTR
jgi:hypothetical protein